jgi:hypothetical protein
MRKELIGVKQAYRHTLGDAKFWGRGRRVDERKEVGLTTWLIAEI